MMRAGLIGSDEAQALPGELNAAVTELRAVAEDLRARRMPWANLSPRWTLPKRRLRQ